MFAIGRIPHRQSRLDNAGVAVNPENGGIAVDVLQNLRAFTSTRSVMSPIASTHAGAIREGHAFADTVFGKRTVAVDHGDIPSAVFSHPRSAPWA